METMTLEISGVVDAAQAENLADRIRLAMGSDIPQIVLRLTNDPMFPVPEFISFLVAASARLKKENRRLCITGVSRKNAAMFHLSGLDNYA